MESLPSALTTILLTFQPLMRTEVFASFGYLLTGSGIQVILGEQTLICNRLDNHDFMPPAPD